MTRQQFIDDITTWQELLDFCCDENCDVCNEIYDEDGMDEFLDYNLVDMARDSYGWRDLLDKLNDIPTGYDFYIRYNEFVGADDDDFERYKDYVKDWMDEGEYWDEDDENEEELEEPETQQETFAECEEPNEDEGFVEDEDISIAELFTVCSSNLQKIDEDKRAREIAAENEANKALAELFSDVNVVAAVQNGGIV